jgi:hypothetical protein
MFLDISELNIDGRVYKLDEKAVMLDLVTVGQVDTPIAYEFVHPWMGLNQDNYRRYQGLGREDHTSFLANILGGNLKSPAKGFDFFIPAFDRIKIQFNWHR